MGRLFHAAAWLQRCSVVDYDGEPYAVSFNRQPGYFALPATGGRMPWWGNPTLAGDLAYALADGFSSLPLPLPSPGPPVWHRLRRLKRNRLHCDLSSLGSTNTVIDGASFTPTSIKTWLVLSCCQRAHR